MSVFNPCFLIPCYNHGATVPAVIDALTSYGFPIIIVDDGSELATRKILSEQAKRPNITVVTLPKNQGKGGAVIAGVKQADALGFSHALQIDADGQHDLAALPKLLEASQAHPEALISGQPIYDDSVPKSRLYGRYATHIWVWIETLSFNIKDSMCGFRSYPIRPIINVINHNKLGLRMDFDTEIMVRFYWDSGDVRFIDTKVIYPENGISHFDALWDNVKISWMHTKLFFGMLPRIPKLIQRKPTDQQHWSSHAERGTILGIKTLLAVYSLLGRKAFNLLLKAVMGYYYLTGKKARKASEDYLEQLESYASDNQLALPAKLNSYDHLLSFGHTMLDKLVAWQGDYSEKNLTIHGDEHFNELAKRKQGIIVLGSHLGNLELCRALSSRHPDIKINALVFTEHAERFNAVLKAINPDSDLNLIQVNELGADTAIMLQQKVEQGEWVVIVGDRTSVTKEQRVVWADFLGKPAPFPQGPFILASVLKVPVYTLFGLRDDSQATPHFDVYFEPFSEQLILPRKTRETALQEAVQRYASRLESYTIKAPLQWYNFFNFWQLSGKNNDNQ
ncbi:glycosyltransferase family 2 protein [Photobacterium lucens]|uniref:glycosyltransferase family 2 protein n=1 Tax=Photobacterium lucens TaxID=2562949 RepID=UPI00136E96A8|nr:glycosyltransferase family 2 protein [Photobacterium lucens]MBP2700095.1 glycosyltransferase family 2 protein [Vibrio parahaemolyticus]MZG56103.1 glycosyltransferase family 2 protein [Photobacterium lucens]MZG79956.1 glycosyltransferase family 2 protein [Photobacterium lucens]